LQGTHGCRLREPAPPGAGGARFGPEAAGMSGDRPTANKRMRRAARTNKRMGEVGRGCPAGRPAGNKFSAARWRLRRRIGRPAGGFVAGSQPMDGREPWRPAPNHPWRERKHERATAQPSRAPAIAKL